MKLKKIIANKKTIKDLCYDEIMNICSFIEVKELFKTAILIDKDFFNVIQNQHYRDLIALNSNMLRDPGFLSLEDYINEEYIKLLWLLQSDHMFGHHFFIVGYGGS